MTVGNSSSRTLHSTCGNLLLALSFIVDGRLSKLLKCSARLSKIASLSVRSVLPSALRNGVVPELFGRIMEFLHVLSVYKGLDLFRFLAQPGILHVTESALDRLTNIVVGCLRGH